MPPAADELTMTNETSTHIQHGTFFGAILLFWDVYLLRVEHPAHLHIFWDASESTYGAVAYPNMSNHVSFLMSKLRLAPTIFLSIPKLVLCCCLSDTVAPHCHAGATSWSQSSVVVEQPDCLLLCLQHNEQIGEIHCEQGRVHPRTICPCKWNYVPSALNPADHVSHGFCADELLACHLFVQVLEFLKGAKDEWSGTKLDSKDISADDPEIKGKGTVNFVDGQTSATDHLICHYSSWQHLKREACFLLKSGWETIKSTPLDWKLQVNVLAQAEQALMKYICRGSIPRRSWRLSQMEMCRDRARSEV